MSGIGNDEYSSRGRGRGTWSPNIPSIGTTAPFRRPYDTINQVTASTNSEHSVQSSGSKSTEKVEDCNNVIPETRLNQPCKDDVIKNSKLSVDAEEFIPQRLVIRSPPSSVPNLASRLEAARIIPMSEQTEPSQNHDHSFQFLDYLPKPAQDSDSNNAVSFYGDTDGISVLQEYINLLTLKPGKFDEVVTRIETLMMSHFHCECPDKFQRLVEIIVEQSITGSNFRYTGARLLKVLDKSAAQKNAHQFFRSLLFHACEKKKQNQIENWKQSEEHSEKEQNMCHGLILFLAELVVQIEGSPVTGMEELLIQFITSVLQYPASNSVKQICQALKLAGRTLEKDANGSSRPGMEDMMKALTNVVIAEKVDSNIGHMVNNIQALRRDNWGNTMDNSTTNKVQQYEYPSPNWPVLYGPDGEVITSEESQFLHDSFLDKEYMPPHDFSDLLQNDDYNDDYDYELEEFLKTIPQHTKNANVRR